MLSDCWDDLSAVKDCCQVQQVGTNAVINCPDCGGAGKTIDFITVKSMLAPHALGGFDVCQTYRFCASQHCNVVYFGNQEARFQLGDVREALFQKDTRIDVDVCYCFGWTRAKIVDEIHQTGKSTAVASINAYIRAGR